MIIRFEQLYFACTFTDPATKLRFVKVDDTHAVLEDDPSDTLATFSPSEAVIV
jgi:hypothetical protein